MNVADVFNEIAEQLRDLPELDDPLTEEERALVEEIEAEDGDDDPDDFDEEDEEEYEEDETELDGE